MVDWALKTSYLPNYVAFLNALSKRTAFFHWKKIDTPSRNKPVQTDAVRDLKVLHLERHTRGHHSK